MEIKVVPLTGPHHWPDFLSLPHRIYCDDPNWTPQAPANEGAMFNPAYNPVLRHQQIKPFLALTGNQPVGRIVAIKDELNPQTGTGFFGCFECINEPTVAAQLFYHAGQWLAGQGLTDMLGPATFNTNQKVGFLIEGFTSGPSSMLPYNPPYYADLAMASGLTKVTDLVSYHWSIEQSLPEVVLKIAARAEAKPGLTVRHLDFRQPDREAAVIREIYNTSFVNNWGFIPLTMAESRAMVNHLRQTGDPYLVWLAFLNHAPAGMLLGMPEKSSLQGAGGAGSRNLRVAILAVQPKLRYRGLHTVLMSRFYDAVRRGGYTSGELSQMDEQNTTINRIVTAITGTLEKRYRVFKA